MNVGEYGLAFNMNVNFNISGFTALSLAITRPDATTLTVVNGAVTVPASPLVTPVGTFNANEYITYLIATGNLTVPGNYTARLTYTDASKRLISDVVSFTVNP